VLPYPGFVVEIHSVHSENDKTKRGGGPSFESESKRARLDEAGATSSTIKVLLNPSLSRRPPLAKNFRVSGTTIGRYGIAYGGTSHGRFPGQRSSIFGIVSIGGPY